MAALTGIRVLELAERVCGEYCGRLLADFGAEVIKIERPGGGSPTRRMGPLKAGAREGENSGLFAYLNTNKQSVTLDLDDADGRSLMVQLLTQADVVIDDHAPGWLADRGLAPEQLEDHRPRLVLCAITPFGQQPPEGIRSAEDLTVMNASGWAFHTPSGSSSDQPPLKGPGRFLASYEAGLDAALCVAAALCGRENTGQGRFIDISQRDVLVSRCDYVVAQQVAGDMPVSRERTAWDLGGPAGVFPCEDGFVYIWMSAPGHWQALGELLGNPYWMVDFPENWLEKDCTPERVAECRRHLAEWLATQRKHEVSEAAQKLGLTLVAVNAPADLLESPQYRHRDYFADVEHPVLGRVRYPTVPYRMSETPPAITSPAPLLGQHSDDWLAGEGERS